MKLPFKEVFTSIALASLVTFGGTALANERSPTDYIKDMVASIVNPILFDVEEYIQGRSEFYSDKIAEIVQETQNNISSELILWKEQEEARAEKELEIYYQSIVEDLRVSIEKESNESKVEITKKTNREIEEAKAKIKRDTTETVPSLSIEHEDGDVDGNDDSELNNENKTEVVPEESDVVEPAITETEEANENDEN